MEGAAAATGFTDPLSIRLAAWRRRRRYATALLRKVVPRLPEAERRAADLADHLEAERFSETDAMLLRSLMESVLPRALPADLRMTNIVSGLEEIADVFDVHCSPLPAPDIHPDTSRIAGQTRVFMGKVLGTTFAARLPCLPSDPTVPYRLVWLTQHGGDGEAIDLLRAGASRNLTAARQVWDWLFVRHIAALHRNGLLLERDPLDDAVVW